MNSSDESSDSSSNEFLVNPDNLNLDSSFFKQSKLKSQTSSKNTSEISESDEDFAAENDEKIDSAALLAEVMKNLENAKKITSEAVKTTWSSSLTRSGETLDKKNDKNCLSADDVTDLLLQGESGLSSASIFKEDEEDAAEGGDDKPPSVYTIPKDGVNITLPSIGLPTFGRKQKRGLDLEDALRRRMNQKLRSNQTFIHKAGLLCWIAHGFCLNRIANDAEILAFALSLVPSNAYPKNRVDLKYLEQFTKWFKNLFRVIDGEANKVVQREALLANLTNKTVGDRRELVLLYIATLRAIGLNCRLVMSLVAPPLKLRREQLFQTTSERLNSVKKEEKIVKKESVASVDKKELIKTKKNQKIVKKQLDKSPLKIIPENSEELRKNAKLEARKRAADVLSKFSNEPNKKSSKTDSPTKGDVVSPPRTRQLRSRTILENLESDDVKEINKIKENDEKLKDKEAAKKRTRATSSKAVKKIDKSKIASTSTKIDTDSEEEFEPKVPAKKIRGKNAKAEKNVKSKEIDRRVLSSDEEPDVVDAKNAQYLWVEVYVDSEESWICVNVPEDKIHCVNEIYKKAPKPVLYVVAWNSVGTLKDVTRRYCPQWLTVTRKQRVDENWWKETLSSWKEKDTVISKCEDEMLLQRELEQPLPKTVGECKGHPLYALARHLLKFEALYPPECIPLGHLKTGEAIYSRHCVHTLRSRETWLKQARVVKPSQEPYKIVKSMPKYDKLSGTMIKDLPLELFGKWQTMQYVPPVAKNGIVPRNEYGNVDLFQQCMLPIGTVHINLPALYRVARKLNIDCVPAVVGFNFGGRGAVPAIEGYVVCEEFEETLRDAWHADQIEASKRANEKREKRIYGNWKKLVKGLFIRERLAARYDFNDGDDENDEKAGKSTSSNKGTKKKVTESKKMNGKKPKAS